MPIRDSLVSTTAPTLNDPPATPGSPVVEIDVKAFVGARALVQANSGGGKSRTLRRILEQTHGKVQHLVIDVEGEFYTLREQFDYLIAGAGGDCAATVKNAGRLVTMLLKTGASAILDISELADQEAFVQAVCHALVSAPRELWHPVLVAIDEAQRFCPQDEEADSTQAVIDLMTRGRKRGFNGVLACQRLSELHKSAAAECNNLIIGRTSLDVDIARARKALGMKAKDAEAVLPRLKPGEFFCVGPGLSETVTKVWVGHVRTTHPEAGSGMVPMVPAREVTKAMLAELADMDEQAVKEESELERLRGRVAELENKLDSVQKIDDIAVEELVRGSNAATTRVNEVQRQLLEAERENEVLTEVVEEMAATLDAVVTRCADIKTDIDEDIVEPLLVLRNMYANRLQEQVEAESNPGTPTDEDEDEDDIPDDGDDPWASRTRAIEQRYREEEELELAKNGVHLERARGDMPPMARAFLTALAQRGKLPKKKILIFANYAAGGAASKTFADLVRNGWMTSDGGTCEITAAGRKALGRVKPLPRGVDLQVQVISGLPGAMERKFLDCVIKQYPRGISKGDILTRTGYAAGGAASKAFAYLVAREYVVAQGPGRLVAAKEFFE